MERTTSFYVIKGDRDIIDIEGSKNYSFPNIDQTSINPIMHPPPLRPPPLLYLSSEERENIAARQDHK